MSSKSSIEWTDRTWNPSTGCTKVSEGCRYCYAEVMARRLKSMKLARYSRGFSFTEQTDKITDPIRWSKPQRIFVNSMSDLFHEQSTVDFLRQVFQTMMATPWHQYQILTKRPKQMAAVLVAFVREGSYAPSPHIWVGTSIEDYRAIGRLEALTDVPAVTRFLSCEPLIGPLGNLDLRGISWVIAGGESGAHLWKADVRDQRSLVEYLDGKWIPRKDRIDWVREIRDACLRQDVAFFFKQWGGSTPKSSGRQLDGRTWDEFPEFDPVELAAQPHAS